MPLLIKFSSPFAAHRHPHLRAPPHVCCHVCRAHARSCLSTGWALNRRFDLTFGTAAVLAQGGGGVLSFTSSSTKFYQIPCMWSMWLCFFCSGPPLPYSGRAVSTPSSHLPHEAPGRLPKARSGTSVFHSYMPSHH